MRAVMTSQQTAFFTQNGYIEIEGLNFDPEELFATARAASKIQPFGRDLWRQAPLLRRLLLSKLGPAIFQLIAKPVRLACDQWMPLSQATLKPSPAQDLFCIQGLVLCALFTASPVAPPAVRAAAFGIPPFTGHPGRVLFVKPNIALNWPLLAQCPADIYLAAYALSNQGVYVHNPKDPATHALKDLGYEFGDVLTEAEHPSLQLIK
jgi:hypothetical protein